MKSKSRSRIALYLSFFAALVFLSDCGSGAQKTVVKRYPEGFSLKHPEGWTARVVDRQYIWIRPLEEKEESAFILVYPFFLREKTESRSWLETNLSRVSRHFEEIKFQKLDRVRPFPDEAAARFSFLRDNIPHEGVALLSAQSGREGGQAVHQDEARPGGDRL